MTSPQGRGRHLPATALALLLADARLPVAGHTQSGGLEPALAAGVTDIPDYMRLRLRTLVRTEAAIAVVARATILRGGTITAVLQAWAARTPSAAMRATSYTMGAALRRLADRFDWLPADLPEAPRPIVLGALSAQVGLPARELAWVVGYDDLQTVAGASLKLMPLDPTQATAWVVYCLPALEELVDSTADMTVPGHIPARNAPAIEHYAETHARTTRKLFNA